MLSDLHIINFENGIDEFITEQIKIIKEEKAEAKKAEEGEKM